MIHSSATIHDRIGGVQWQGESDRQRNGLPSSVRELTSSSANTGTTNASATPGAKSSLARVSCAKHRPEIRMQSGCARPSSQRCRSALAHRSMDGWCRGRVGRPVTPAGLLVRDQAKRRRNRMMSEQATIGALRAEIARLQGQEREYLSEPRRADREKRREQLIGRWWLQHVHTQGSALPIPSLDVSGDEAWLFSDEALQADGYEQRKGNNGDEWWKPHLPSDRAGP